MITPEFGTYAWHVAHGSDKSEAWFDEHRAELLAAGEEACAAFLAKKRAPPLEPASTTEPGNLVFGLEPPPQDKPCWVLFDRGLTSQFRGQRRGHKIALAEFAWDGGAWRRTETPEIWPTSVYDALRKADWFGRLPQQGRKRRR